MFKKTSSLFYISSKFLTHFINLFSIFFITKSLFLDQIATVNQFLIVIEIAIIVLLGIPDGVLYFISKDKNKYLGMIISFIRNYSWLYLLIGLSLGFFLPIYFSNNELNNFYFNYSILLFSSIIISIFEAYLMAVNKFSIAAILSIILGLTKLIVVLMLFFHFIYLVEFIHLLTIIFFLGGFFAFFSLYNLEKDYFFRKDKISKQFLTEFINYSIPLWFSSIIGTLNKLIDKFMVGYFFSTSDFGIYSVLGRDLPYTVITATLISLTTPIIIRMVSLKNYDSAFIIWKRSVILSSFFIIFAIFSNFLMVDEIIIFLYSRDFLRGKNIFLIYLLNLLPHVAYWGMFSKTFMKTKLILIISVLGLIINILLNFIFIPIWGLEGPAFATLLVSLLSVVSYIVINQNLTKNRFIFFIPFKEIIIFVLENIVILFIMLFILNIPLFYSMNVFVKLLIVSILWFLILYFMNIKLINGILKNGIVSLDEK